MTTFAETYGDMPTLTPITTDVHEFTSPEALAALEAFAPAADDILTDDAQDAPEVAARWTIDSEDKANWYLRKLRQIDDEAATVKAQAAEMLRALEADRNKLNARHEADFQAWAKEELSRRKTGRKTLPLFQGTVAFRTVPASMRITAAPAIEEAKARGWTGLVKTFEGIDADSYRREAASLLAATGEVLPGIEIIPERESVSIRFGKGKAEGDTD